MGVGGWFPSRGLCLKALELNEKGWLIGMAEDWLKHRFITKKKISLTHCVYLYSYSEFGHISYAARVLFSHCADSTK